MSQANSKPRISARIEYHGLHVASIDREAYEAIADQPLFDDHPHPPGTTTRTFRSFIEPRGALSRSPRRVMFAAGLVDRLTAKLLAHGYEVLGGDQNRDFSAGNELNPEVAERFRRADLGPRSLIRIPSLAKRIRFIAELSKSGRAAHTLVIARNNREAAAAGRQLKVAAGREVTWGFMQRRTCPWLHVKSLQALSGDSAAQWDRINFLDAELALTATAIQFLASGHHSSRIAFLKRPAEQLHEEDRAGLEALFGPIEGTREEWCLEQVHVAWLRPPIFHSPGMAGEIERLRKGIWGNQARNRLIARAARAFSEEDTTGLDELGLRKAAKQLADNSTGRATVTILAANREHSDHLSELLPEWRTEASGYEPLPFQKFTDDRLIMTLARASETVVATTVVFYAAAGRDWWINEVQFGFACGSDATLIVDVDDCFDAQAGAEANARAAQYRQLRYSQTGRSDS